MMFDYRRLLNTCVKALDEFKITDQSVEEHIKAFLKKQDHLSDDDHTFLVEVFSGCVFYSKFLNLAVDGFYRTDGKSILRNQRNMLKVICYLLIFRLNELRITHLRKFILSQHTATMHKFLCFLLHKNALEGWLYDQWCGTYDSAFVDKTVMAHFKNWKDEFEDIVATLSTIIDNNTKTKPSSKSPVKPHPFNLTQPKSRAIMLPDKIPKMAKTRPPPKYIYQEPKEISSIEEIKDEHHQAAMKKLMDAHENSFRCAYPEKSDKTKQTLQRILDEDNKKLNFNQIHSHGIPKATKTSKPIKMNTAAILREGQQYIKREKEGKEHLVKLLNGEKDKAEFLAWQNEMLRKDNEAKAMESEYRKVMGKITREQAILAKKYQEKEKKNKVADHKLETAKMMQDYLTFRLEEEKQMRMLVEQIAEGHQNAQEAKVKLREYKQKIVQEVNAQSREMMRQALEEAEEEMKRKTELIQQIRAMESVPIERKRLVDTTATAGHGYLSEMSIAELHERLSLLKEQNLREEEEKRNQIIKDKQAKTDSVLETIARISTHRNVMNKAQILEAERKQKYLEECQAKLQSDEMLLSLKEKLQLKKEEKMRLVAEMAVSTDRKSSSRSKSLIREKKTQEKNRWNQLEQTQQRLAEMRSKSHSAGVHSTVRTY